MKQSSPFLDGAAGGGRAPILHGETLWLAILAAGGLSALGQAPLHWWPLTAVGFSWFILLLDKARETPRPLRSAFARGFCFGAGHFLVSMYWIGAPFLQLESAKALWPLGFLLPLGLALFWGAAAAAAAAAWPDDARRIPWFAAVFTTFEWLRGTLFGGLPWALPGYVWEAGSPVSQVAAGVGVYGLTAVTVLLFCTPALVFDSRRRPEARVAPALAAALTLGLIWGAGVQRLSRTPEREGDFAVRVLDSGLTQAEKWAPGAAYTVFQRYLELTGSSQESSAEVVIWPESALPFPLLEYPELLDVLGQQLDDRVLITGLTRIHRSEGAADPVLHNSAAVLDAVNGDLRVGQIYDKVRLVPFGEFIPLWGVVQRLGLPIQAMQQIGSGFAPGPGPARMVVPGAATAAPLICFEAIFPGFVLRGADRPDWLINVTNDAWFSYGQGWPVIGPLQHYNQARYRAIEEGLPMARAASGGVSAVIDQYGREIASTGLNGGAVEATLPKRLDGTMFSRWGFLVSSMLVLVLAAARLTPGLSSRGRIL